MAIKAIQAMDGSPDFFAVPSPAMRTALLDAIDMVLLPMLDGIIQREADDLTKAAIKAFHLDGDDEARITERMKSVACVMSGDAQAITDYAASLFLRYFRREYWRARNPPRLICSMILISCEASGRSPGLCGNFWAMC